VHTFYDECFYIAERALKGDIWIASFNDAVKYLYEYKNAKISTQGNEITVSCDLDKEIFNHPLTIVVSSDTDEQITVNGVSYDIKAGKENVITFEL
jgi:hypothetical protein